MGGIAGYFGLLFFGELQQHQQGDDFSKQRFFRNKRSRSTERRTYVADSRTALTSSISSTVRVRTQLRASIILPAFRW